MKVASTKKIFLTTMLLKQGAVDIINFVKHFLNYTEDTQS